MSIHGRFMVSNTGPTKDSLAIVRIYGPDGLLVGSVEVSAYDGLKYIRQHPKSKYRHMLVCALRSAGATDDELDSILQISTEK